MDADTILAGWRARQKELRALIEKHQYELRELSAAIACLERDAAIRTRAAPKQEPTLFDGCEFTGESAVLVNPPAVEAAELKSNAAGRRVPLTERRSTLLDYLMQNGPSSRASILKATSIPAGSLSSLLTRGSEAGWLLKTENGCWKAA